MLVVIGIIIGFRILNRPPVDVAAQPESADVLVVRVVDGDTLLIDGGERVRLLGIDTPETRHPKLPPEPFGREATEFTTQAIEGKIVHLEFDIERYDDYGRILAFVFLDGVMLNEQLVAAGLATAEPQYHYRGDYKKRLVAAEQSAQFNRLGIWSDEVTTSPERSANPEPRVDVRIDRVTNR